MRRMLCTIQWYKEQTMTTRLIEDCFEMERLEDFFLSCTAMFIFNPDAVDMTDLFNAQPGRIIRIKSGFAVRHTSMHAIHQSNYGENYVT
jgi:hypothetical protein